MVFEVNNSQEQSGRAQEKRSKASIWKDAIEQLVDPTYGMSEEEQSNYEKKIMQKLKSGKPLTSEELEYLRLHNPDLYRSAIRVETERKALQSRLKSCKSKEEVRQVISGQMEILKAMEGDPDQGYMAAMADHEIDKFRKSAAYARLPERREDGKKKTAENGYPTEKEDEMDSLQDSSVGKKVYTQTQLQCEQISQIAQGIL